MATPRKTGSEKFISFVNSRIGKQLSTVGISKGTRTHLRTVQTLCKSVRTRAARKVVTVPAGKGRGMVYTFKSPITTGDIK